MTVIDELVAVPAEPSRSQLQRGLAFAQQVKDSIIIVLMLSTGMLLLGICFGIAIPGLVLYCLRLKLTQPNGGRIGWLWLLTLLHELVCAVGFYSNHPNHDEMTACHFELGYALGVGFSLVALLSTIRRLCKKPD